MGELYSAAGYLKFNKPRLPFIHVYIQQIEKRVTFEVLLQWSRGVGAGTSDQ
jgi:hypothetical protein